MEPPALSTTCRTGAVLREDIRTLDVQHVPLIEGLLYQRHVSFIAGEPGGGKSIIAMQMALSLSSGTLAFDSLPVAAPTRVYYLQLEGSYPDTIDRMRRMETKVPLNPDNLVWDFRTGLDLLNRAQGQALLESLCIWQPEVFMLDPLYQAVFGELSSELPTKALIKFLDAVRGALPLCAILLIHHTHRRSYANGKTVEEDDPFYGSQWLKAYVDSSYLLRQPSQGRYKDHVFLVNKKDRYAVSAKELLLHYDPETDTVSTDAPLDEQSPYERTSKFLAQCKKAGKTTDFFEVAAVTGISYRHLRRLMLVLIQKGLLRADKRSGHKKIWEPLG